jgi:probable O-glycosylation ligase (exosortase A-associated)
VRRAAGISEDGEENRCASQPQDLGDRTVLRNLLLVVAYLAILGMGVVAPFVFTLGYVWVDMFRPEAVLYGPLKEVPLAFIIGAAAVASYFVFDRRFPPRMNAITFLTITFAFWVTATTFWAVAPVAAWAKWDWAFKSVAFSAFIPFVLRSRNHIEAFLQVYIFSLAGNFIPFGAKALVTGGGYGQTLGLITQGNTPLSEGSTVAMLTIMNVPVILFLMKHGRLIPRNPWTKLGYGGLLVLTFATAVGTHERTAVVAMVLLALTLWISTKRKILVAVLCVAIGATVLAAAPASWTERMATISANPQDDSAAGRLAVWRWTLDFVKTHPFGGGFESYRVNQITLGDEETGLRTQYSRAFHSIYFEVLGEHGWLGLGLFLGIALASINALRSAARRAKGHEDLRWAGDLSRALRNSLFIALSCGAFIGVAFQPFLYYFFALALCLREYVHRVQQAPVSAVEAGSKRFEAVPA